MSDNEIRIDNDFLVEVNIDEVTGETVVGRTYRGKGYKSIPLMSFFNKAYRIGENIKIASVTKRSMAKKRG